jgi:hypothetical protein
VMHETTMRTTPAVLRHVKSKGSGEAVAYWQAIDTSLQYFLAVWASVVLVRPLLLTAEHPR